ncbi:MAG: hypothetical protein H0W84_09880 [Bacteroidetes bacterium]|nr:hypothetical protein [Bacteroidota bacterium]
MKKILIFFLLLSFSTFAQTNKEGKKFEIKFKAETSDKKSDDIYVNVYEINNNDRKLILTKKISKIKFAFDFNKEYIASFSKNGYVTKEVFVTTMNVSEKRLTENFGYFTFSLKLKKQSKDTITQLLPPVATIFFSVPLDGFAVKFPK